jgi:hypothetical protein
MAKEGNGRGNKRPDEPRPDDAEVAFAEIATGMKGTFKVTS